MEQDCEELKTWQKVVYSGFWEMDANYFWSEEFKWLQEYKLTEILDPPQNADIIRRTDDSILTIFNGSSFLQKIEKISR